MIEKYNGGIIPDPVVSKERTQEIHIGFIFSSNSKTVEVPSKHHIILFNNYDNYIPKLEFGHAISLLWRAISYVNKYIEDSAPWKEKDKGTLSNILYTLAESLRLIAVYIFPFIPFTGNEIWRQLGINASIEKTIPSNPKFRDWGGYKLSGTKTAKSKPLFPRIEKKGRSSN
jgi:methionyl-tRNA synthetase